MGKIKKTSPKRDKLHKISKQEVIPPRFSKISKKASKKLKDATPVKRRKIKKRVIVNTTSAAATKICYDQVERGIQALLEYTSTAIPKDLFDAEKIIYLQFQCIRIPIGPNLRFRLPVKNSLVTDQSEICLIVPDLKKRGKTDHEETVQHYEEFLKSRDVTRIKRVLPFRQLRAEYETFELKRRLLGYYDYFLVDGKIAGHVSHFLGKTFYKSPKMPIPIHVTHSPLNECINKALSKVLLHVRYTGDSYMVPVAHSKMTVKMILENIKCVVKSLCSFFPGGFENIRSVFVKFHDTISVPVYLTLKSANDVPVPVIKRKRPKEYQSVIGDLSTLPHHKVVVHPTGEVDVINADKKPKIKDYNKISLKDNMVLVDFPIVRRF